MKKLLYFIVPLMMLVFAVSCSKSDDGNDDNDDSCNEDVFISLDSTNSNTQSEMIDFDVFNQTPVFPNSMSSSSIAAPSGFYETKDIPVDPNTLATANIIGKK